MSNRSGNCRLISHFCDEEETFSSKCVFTQCVFFFVFFIMSRKELMKRVGHLGDETVSVKNLSRDKVSGQ